MAQSETPRLPTPAAALDYATDAWQRSVLFLDVMRRRAAQYEAHAAELGRAGQWVDWSEDEPCAQRGVAEDTITERGSAQMCR